MRVCVICYGPHTRKQQQLQQQQKTVQFAFDILSPFRCVAIANVVDVVSPIANHGRHDTEKRSDKFGQQQY